MQKLIRGLAIATIVLAGTALRVQRAHADTALVHGCWFTPPNPPSCATCADNCNPYQKCCIIVPL